MSNLAVEFKYGDKPVGSILYVIRNGYDALRLMDHIGIVFGATDIKDIKSAIFNFEYFTLGDEPVCTLKHLQRFESRRLFYMYLESSTETDDIEKYKSMSEYKITWDLKTDNLECDVFKTSSEYDGEYFLVKDDKKFCGTTIPEPIRIYNCMKLFKEHPVVKYGDLYYIIR